MVGRPAERGARAKGHPCRITVLGSPGLLANCSCTHAGFAELAAGWVSSRMRIGQIAPPRCASATAGSPGSGAAWGFQSCSETFDRAGRGTLGACKPRDVRPCRPRDEQPCGCRTFGRALHRMDSRAAVGRAARGGFGRASYGTNSRAPCRTFGRASHETDRHAFVGRSAVQVMGQPAVRPWNVCPYKPWHRQPCSLREVRPCSHKTNRRAAAGGFATRTTGQGRYDTAGHAPAASPPRQPPR